MKVNCWNCEKELERRPCRAKGRNYCNAKCQLEYEYKNGIKDKFKITKKANQALRNRTIKRFKTKPRRYISKRGYWIIYVPGRGDLKEHHYIWEKKYGFIPKGMILHHINFDKLDNRIENLKLMNQSDHCKLHWAKRIMEKLN